MTYLPLFLLARAPTLEKLLERPGANETTIGWWKLFLALAAIGALIYEASRESEGNPVSRTWKRRAGAFFAFGAVVCYFQFFQIGFTEYYHRWELFHYYMGSKYFREIGYEGIYTCTAVAENDLGFGKAVRARKLRDLRTDDIVSTADALAHPEVCKDAFTPEKWESFKHDVAFFRRVSGSGSWWNDMQADHGYNPTPVWGVMGWALSWLNPAVEWYMKLLSCLDIALFSAMFGCVAWAFGWRVACLAITFWGTQAAASAYWTLGAFLRHDWFTYAVISACMVRKKKYFWGGAFLGYATLLRVFPMFLFSGWIVVAASHVARQWKRAKETGAPLSLKTLLHPHHRQLAAGAIAAALVLVPASVAVAGTRAWPEFIRRIRAHANSPVTNNMGWRTIVGHGAEGRMQVTRDNRLREPFTKWKQARQDRVANLRVVYYGGMALMLGLFVYACWNLRTLWIAQALSCLPTMLLVEVTGYYFSYFVLGALLSKGRRPVELGMMIAAALSEVVLVSYFYIDDHNAAWSVVFLNLALFFVALYSRRPKFLARATEGADRPARAGA
ncbi:MAG TPA: hypothetical protein VFS00_09390 [Polyangiaceae bacterium]|nr:hypothetical protein [Polyangiaceae bacterium]